MSILDFNETAVLSIEKLHRCLEVFKIPHTISDKFDGKMVTFDWVSNADVVAHSHSYGVEKGHVESIGFPWDESDVTEDDPEGMASSIAVYYLYLSRKRNDFHEG